MLKIFIQQLTKLTMEHTDKKYKGVIVPMVTPFNEDLSIDLKAVKTILDTFLKKNTSPFLLGTTGESVSVSGKQKILLVKSVVEYLNKRIKVYAGISDNCLQESIDKAKIYNDIGVDAVVAHLPYYYPVSSDQMVRYYKQLADSIPCRLLMYNNPFTTNLSIPLEVIEQLSHHSNIVGIKDSERGMERMDRSVELCRGRSDFVYLAGWAEQSAYALLNGASGIVPSAGNLIPNLYGDLYESAIQDKLQEAYDLQKKANGISDLYQKDRNLSQSIAALKTVMSVYGLCQPHVMPPLYNMDISEQKQLEVLIKAGLDDLNYKVK